MVRPSEIAVSASSSRSGSFIIQCANRLSSSSCGPPPSKPRDQSQAWSEARSATRPLSDPVYDQQRCVVQAFHERVAVALGSNVDLSNPPAPGMFGTGCRILDWFQALGHRVALPDAGHLWQVGEFVHQSAGCGREKSRQAANGRLILPSQNPAPPRPRAHLPPSTCRLMLSR